LSLFKSLSKAEQLIQILQKKQDKVYL